MGMFGWSYPPGCSAVPGDEPEGPCLVCGGDVNCTPKEGAKQGIRACICPACPVCGEIGNPDCYKSTLEGGHGIAQTQEQLQGWIETEKLLAEKDAADAMVPDDDGDWEDWYE